MEIKDNIIYRADKPNRFDEMPSLGHMMVKNLTAAGDKTVLVDGITGEKLSAIELVNKSIEIAKGLLAAGLKKGDVVSIVSENRFEYAFVMFGTIFNNCIMAPINNTYTSREIIHALNLSKPKVIFVSESLSKTVVELSKSLGFIEKVVLLDGNTSIANKTISLSEFLNPERLKTVQFILEPVDKPKTCCFIMCSSGTTGLPKGVQLSQSNIIASTAFMNDHFLCDSNVGTGERVLLGLLPLFHAYGASVLTCTLGGALGKIVLLPKFEQKSFLDTIQNHKCTVTFLVPPLMVFLAKNENVDKYDLSSVRIIFCGGAPMSKELEQSVRDRLKKPQLFIKQGYGMTELTFSVTNQKNIDKAGSIGDIYANVYAKVVDKKGKALGSHQQGELCFKGSVMMMGYINDEVATNATIDKDGWLHTGDVGYYDEDLQFFIVDRIKELIKWKGFQVPPAELEALLLTHPNIKDCGVVGKPDEAAGEVAVAFVVRDDSGISEADIIKFVAERTSPAKRLHGGVIFIDEIPKNPSGKILRRELRELLKKLKSKL